MKAKDYLPGALISAFFGKCRSLTQDEKTKIGKLWNWMIITLEYNNKKVVIINACKLTKTSPNWDCCSVTKHNKVDGKVKTTNE